MKEWTHGLPLFWASTPGPYKNRGAGGQKPRTLAPLPRFLLISIFYEMKKIVLNWKIVENYKTRWNSSKFADIYNIIIELNTRDGISCQ